MKEKRQLLQDFSRRASKYGQKVLVYTDEKLYRLMLKGLKLSDLSQIKNWKILDLAAGCGLSSEPFRRKGADIFYLDVSRAMLERGIMQGWIQPNRAIIGHVEEVSSLFPKEFFDLVLIRFALHDVRDIHSVFSSVHSLLKENGRFQIVDMALPKRAGTKALFFYNYQHAWKTSGNPRECFIRPIENLEAIADEHSFKIISKFWYRSRVLTTDWIAENQIDEKRLRFLNELVSLHAKFFPSIKKLFRIEAINEHSLHISFPVVILTLMKIKGF